MNRHSSTQGSAILMAFWAIMVMSFCVLGLVAYVYSNLDDTTTLAKDARAFQLAQSGIAIGMHPLVSRRDPVLRQVIAPGEEVQVHLRSEGGRLNINTIVQNQNWTVLQSLFTQWGMKEDDVLKVLNSFQEWAKPMSATGQAMAPGQAAVPVVAGVTGTGQIQVQTVRLFQSVDEMLTIPGMDLVAGAKPDWRNYFTIWSDGGLDMNEAPADLIDAVCGVGMRSAQNFVKTRLGPDGKPDTDDDLILKDMEQVRSLLGMSEQEFALIQGQLSLQDSTVRIESTGSFGGYQRNITAVVRRNASPPIFLQWQEY
jgi:type II secretory pathway component PulK